MPRTTTGPASRAALTAVFLTVSGLLLAGCGSGSGGAAKAAAGSTAPSPGATSADAYRQCLAQHGVTPAPRPSGSRGPGGGPGGWGQGSRGPGGGPSADPKRQEAAQACASLRPQFGGGRGGGGDGSAMKAFTGCLKDHGVALPSASPNAPGMRGFPTSDPASAQAFETCKALLPQRPHATPTPGTTPSA
ncbi:hypothetical protein [Streptomyces sp. NPDC058157]|uniref:hypothetical protein n=1 Tax=Streptomyces sp. NPDC058157 TaxID=3346360 RepID=UPI0036ED5BA9